GVLRSGVPSPMLAHKYHESGKQSGSKTLKQLGIEGKLVHLQPKLDGCRAVIKLVSGKEETTCTFHTRKGDVMVVQLPHIAKHLINWFDELYCEEGDEIILDGELFSDE